MANNIVEQMKDWYESASSVNAEWVARAKRTYQFYTGVQQWDLRVVAALEAAGRPALTINKILATVNTLGGHQRQNRSDIVLYPLRGGTNDIAALGTELLKHAISISNGQYQMSEAFETGLICGKGWLSAERSYLNDPINGELIIRHELPFDMLEDQSCKDYDLDRCEFVFKTYWWDRAQVELQYPGKSQHLGEATEHQEWAGDKAEVIETDGDYDFNDAINKAEGREDQTRKTKWKVRECWYKTWDSVVYVIDTVTMDIVARLPSGTRGEAQQLLDQYSQLGDARAERSGQLRIMERIGQTLHRTLSIGEQLLETEDDPLKGLTAYPFFRYCPYWSLGYPFGMVENLIGPQQELNKRRSQTLHHANQGANSPWLVNSTSDVTATEELRETGSMPGMIIDRSKFGGDVERVPPAPMDSAHLTLSEMASKDITEISGVNSDLMGTDPRASESGKARLVRQSAALVVSESIFDRFHQTQGNLGQFLWDLIRRSDLYSQQEIEAIVQEHTLKRFMRPDPATGQMAVDVTPIQGWKAGRYGVKVSKGQSAPTVRMAQFEQLMELAEKGLPIPPEYLIEMSDVPHKEEIIEDLKAQEQMQQQGAMLPA